MREELMLRAELVAGYGGGRLGLEIEIVLWEG